MSQFNSIRFQPSRPLLKEVTADRLNGIIAEIKKNRPKGERGITVRQTGDGAFIGLAATLRGEGAAEQKPWDIYVDDVIEEDNKYKLKVVPGTLAGILAENWDDEFEVVGNELFYGIAKVETDGTYINAVSIVIQEDEPQLQSAVKWGIAESVDVLFGIFKDGASYNVTGGKDISVANRNVIVTPANNAPPGSPQFELWFRLQ